MARPSVGSRSRSTIPAVVVALATFAALLPGVIQLPPLDRDEARFAQASRQMLRSSDWQGWIVPRIQDRPRLAKPPLVYWLQAGCAALLAPFVSANGPYGGVWPYRIPSVLSAVAATWMTVRLASRMFDPRIAPLAGALLAACLVVQVDARQARADQVLLALHTLTMWALWECWRAARRGAAGDSALLRWTLILWVALGFAVLCKGPVTPAGLLLAVLTLGLVTGEWAWVRRLRPVLGLLIAAVIVTPWVVLCANAVGWERYFFVLWDEVVNRSLGAKEGHGGLPGTYLALSPLLLWPGSLALPATLAWVTHCMRASQTQSRGWLARLRREMHPGVLFCLACSVPLWIAFELAGTKLPHYVLPTFPFLAILLTRTVYALDARHLQRLPTWATGSTVRITWCVLTLAVTLLVPGALLMQVEQPPAWLWALACLPSMLGICACWCSNGSRWTPVLWTGVASSVAVAGVTLAAIAPRAAVHLSVPLAAAWRAADPQAVRPLAAYGYHEDSLIYLTDGHVQRLGMLEVENWLRANPQGLLISELDDHAALLRLRPLAEVEGFNYNEGRRMRVILGER